MPVYKLQYPEGWLATRLDSSDLPQSGSIRCVNSLNKPSLW